MEIKKAPTRRRRRTSGFVPRIKGNELFTRCLEELEKHLSPRRSGLALFKAVSLVGATPETVTLGHLVRACDLTLRAALEEHCEPEEAQEIAQGFQLLLDDLAQNFFAG
jgi:hypothetical protein